MSDADETILLDRDARSLSGGGGFDILDFGNLQARWTSGWNHMFESGGRFSVSDPATGQSWTLEFVGFEGFKGSPYDDRIYGNALTSFIDGGAGDDTLGAQVMDTPFPITIFGGEGRDSLSGSEMGDLVNGNQGDDQVHGWEGDDWLYGGKDNDTIDGDDGADFVNGNLGADTIDGGAGADTLHGGQANDVIRGGTGDDHLLGDLGDDTLTGGRGADAFHVAAGGGNDRIIDFNASEGDRVLVAAGSAYALSQSGPNVVISFSGGEAVVLAGVTLNSLPAGWITEG